MTMLDSSPVDVVESVVRSGHETRIVLTGELDILTAKHVRDVIDAECDRQPVKLVLDLGGVEFVDSHTLCLFVETHHRLRAQGCELLVLPPAPEVRRAFEITHLDRLFW